MKATFYYTKWLGGGYISASACGRPRGAKGSDLPSYRYTRCNFPDGYKVVPREDAGEDFLKINRVEKPEEFFESNPGDVWVPENSVLVPMNEREKKWAATTLEMVVDAWKAWTLQTVGAEDFNFHFHSTCVEMEDECCNYLGPLPRLLPEEIQEFTLQNMYDLESEFYEDME